VKATTSAAPARASGTRSRVRRVKNACTPTVETQAVRPRDKLRSPSAPSVAPTLECSSSSAVNTSSGAMSQTRVSRRSARVTTPNAAMPTAITPSSVVHACTRVGFAAAAPGSSEPHSQGPPRSSAVFGAMARSRPGAENTSSPASAASPEARTTREGMSHTLPVPAEEGATSDATIKTSAVTPPATAFSAIAAPSRNAEPTSPR
jgi:hypothetical protein